ncbi:MAG: outer membrane scaffolding protein for murein synthesis (MipA/OmpV family) [Pseudohongiellaceae bacterium]|jgi:outer membrane scaffolding protein for murein synthesis (MipA/OmpV family)
MKQLYLALVIVSLCINNVFAADIATDIRKAAEAPDISNGGYFEIGLGFDYTNDSRLSVADDEDGYGEAFDIGGSYRYNGLFVELSQGTLDGLSLGYHLWANDKWIVDLLGSSINGTLTSGDDEDLSGLSEAQRNDALIDRDTFYNGAGVRATGYFGDTIFQYRLVTDIHDDNGIVSTLRLGRSGQLRNWNFHGVVSADYASAKTSHYWYGVSQSDATARFQEYNAGSTMSYTAEIGLTYPMSEHFVFRSTARHTRFSNEVQDSPLTDGNNSTYIATSINYVF